MLRKTVTHPPAQARASILALVVFFTGFFGCIIAQAGMAQTVTSPDPGGHTTYQFVNQSEFAFARLVYHGNDMEGWGPRWRVDWPEAETHLLAGIKRLTRVNSRDEGVLIRLDNDTIFDFPWIYAVEVGSLSLNDYEAQRLREYCLRGGFLMVDDFHGPSQWANFEAVMKRVFPNRDIIELKDDNTIFHVLYDLPDRQQIPGIRPLRSGRTWERGGNIPHWRAILDDNGRIMVAINFNMDLGDAWEHADWPEYPAHYSALAYQVAINYVLYAMTH